MTQQARKLISHLCDRCGGPMLVHIVENDSMLLYYHFCMVCEKTANPQHTVVEKKS